jgi:hypothetical protein
MSAAMRKSDRSDQSGYAKLAGRLRSTRKWLAQAKP